MLPKNHKHRGCFAPKKNHKKYVVVLPNNKKVFFEAEIAEIDNLENYFGHLELDAKGETYNDGESNLPILEKKANFYLGEIEIVNGALLK